MVHRNRQNRQESSKEAVEKPCKKCSWHIIPNSTNLALKNGGNSELEITETETTTVSDNWGREILAGSLHWRVGRFEDRSSSVKSNQFSVGESVSMAFWCKLSSYPPGVLTNMQGKCFFEEETKSESIESPVTTPALSRSKFWTGLRTGGGKEGSTFFACWFIRQPNPYPKLHPHQSFISPQTTYETKIQVNQTSITSECMWLASEDHKHTPFNQ